MNFKVILPITALTLAGLFANTYAIDLKRMNGPTASQMHVATQTIPEGQTSAHTIQKILKKLDKKALVKDIKNDIYAFFVKGFELDKEWLNAYSLRVRTHMRFIVGKQFLGIAQGHPYLASDLEDVYASFAISKEIAQEELDKLCAKWALEPIKITEIC